MRHGGFVVVRRTGWAVAVAVALFALDGRRFILAQQVVPPPAKEAGEAPKPAPANPPAPAAGQPKPAEAPDDKAQDNGAGALRKAREALRKAGEEQPAAVPRPGAAQPRLPALPGQIQMRGVAVPFGRRGLRPQGGTGDAGEDEPIFFPADRATLQRLSKAQELLEQKRFGEAVRLLGDILDGPEDYFYQPKRDEPIYRSLKAEAQRLIGELPVEGRDSYEVLYGTVARQRCNEAIAKGDVAALSEISRRFFHTKAGYDATFLLAEWQRDHGQPLAAALSYKRLRGAAGGGQLESTLAIRAAACLVQAGMSEKAQATLTQIPQQHRNERTLLAGKLVPLFHRDEEALGWLAQVVGVKPSHPVDGDERWAMYRGSPSRNSISNGSSPLLSRRWAIPTSDAFGPVVDDLVKQLRDTTQEQGSVLLCSLNPLAVDDLVFMRTVGGLLAVNFATGKRVWPGPVDESIRQLLDPGSGSNTTNPVARLGNARVAPNAGAALVPRWLSHRLWEDATYGTMSSDGVRVFCVEDMDAGLGVPDQRQVVLPNGRRIPQPVGPRSFNRLAAYTIATEGKLQWDAGGAPGETQSELAGAYFLGAPLPLGDKVYAMTELKGEIRLVALDATSGKLAWSQQLAVVEMNSGNDQLRRTSGISPSYADGVMVCPTSAGAIVALDLTTRSLLWGYQYSRSEGNAPEIGRLGLMRNTPAVANYVGGANRWMDATVTLAGGCALVTPHESNALHCLNLADGKLLWQKPREDGLYIGCVHDKRVVVIGRNNVRALGLADGEPLWPEQALALPVGSTPTGRGFFNGQRYHLPLSTAEVAAIDVETGRIVARSRSRSGAVPGNLICHRGAVLSQNIDCTERFDQRDDLWQQITAAIAADPDDVTALTRRGELLLDEGNFREATGSLRRSLDLKHDPRTRDLLVDALLEGLRVDFPAHRDRLAEMETLIDQPAQRSRFLRLVAAGWQAGGNAPAAFEAYLRIASSDGSGNDLERLDKALSVRRDVWVQARVRELLAEARPAERNDMERTIRSRLDAAAKESGTASLRTFLSFYGTLPIADAAREQFATRLTEEGAFAEAELALQRMESAPDPRRAGRATAQYAALLASAKRYEDAAVYYRRLNEKFADVECLDGKTGRQIVSEIPDKSEIKRLLAPAESWPVGAVEADENKSPAGIVTRHFAMDLTGPLAPFYEYSSLSIDQQQQMLLSLDGSGRERWRVPLRDPSQGFNHNAFFGNGQMIPARINGHVVLVSMGYQIVAIDTLGGPGQEGARVLWRHDLVDRAPSTPFQPTQLVIQVPWAVQRVGIADQMGRPLGNMGPLTPERACYQRMRSVIAVRPLTGESLWIRNDVEPGSDIFGDEELLFIVPPNSEDALVVRPLDGQELGRRKVPPSVQRMVTLGRRVVSWLNEIGQVTLKVTDAWSGTEIWQRRFPDKAKAWLAGDEVVGVMAPDGNFVLLSLADGKPIVEEKLAPEPRLSEIYVLRGPDQYILATNRPPDVRNSVNRQPVMGGIGNPLLTGRVYLFDRHTGKKIGSVSVDRQGLLLSQPAGLPILTFATLVYDQRKSQRQNGETELLVVDKRTARIVHEEKLQQTPQLGLDIVGDPAKRQVVFKTQGAAVRLTFTGKPLAEPAAPQEASDSESDTTRAGKAVLRGLQNWFQGITPRPAPMIPGEK